MLFMTKYVEANLDWYFDLSRRTTFGDLIYGLMDLFASANRIALEKTPQQQQLLNINRWQIAPDSGQVEEILEFSDPDCDRSKQY